MGQIARVVSGFAILWKIRLPTINSDIVDRVVILNFAGDESVPFRVVFYVGRRRAAAAVRGGLKIWKIGFSGYSSSLKVLYLFVYWRWGLLNSGPGCVGDSNSPTPKKH